MGIGWPGGSLYAVLPLFPVCRGMLSVAAAPRPRAISREGTLWCGVLLRLGGQELERSRSWFEGSVGLVVIEGVSPLSRKTLGCQGC